MSTQTPTSVPGANVPGLPPVGGELAESSAFLAEIYRLAADQEDRAMDAIFDYVNALLMAGRFDRCDQLLRLIECDKLPPVLWISFLTITAAAKDKLAERRCFYDKTKTKMIERRGADAAARLLVGLE